MEELFSYLNSLDDDYYFFVANTTLGKVATPYHKPVVNSSILSFLINNKNSIVQSLDEDDRRYLTLVSIAGRATSRQISSFFSTESFPIVLTALESLRDRLILLKNDEFYFVNPVLKETLGIAFDADLAFGENKGLEQKGAVVNRNVLFSVLNLLSNGSVPPREANAHHFAKSDKLIKVFPQFDKKTSLFFFSKLKALLVSENVVSPADGRFVIDREKAEEILKLDDLNLLILVAGTGYGTAITRVLGLLREHSLSTDQAKVLLGIFSDEKIAESILSIMINFGFVTENENCIRLNSAVLEKPLSRSSIGVDSDMEITYYGVPEHDDILYLFSDIDVCDNLVRYRLSKDSFIRALDLGLTEDQIASFLGTDKLNKQFELWKASYSRIRLYDGLVISCSKEVGAMIRRHPNICTHIVAEPGSNIFVMDRSEKWQQALSYALDLAHLPLPKGIQSKGQQDIQSILEQFHIPEPIKRQKKTDWDDGENRKKILVADAKAKGCLTDEVKALIDARLIVSESQIGKGFRYATLQTIGGFDYSAKLTAIRNLLKKKNSPLLKLELRDETILVEPVELMKGEGILKVRVLPQGMEKSIAVSSIFKATVMRWTLA